MKKKVFSLKTYLSSTITILISSIIVSFISFSYAAYLNKEIHNHTITVNMDYSSYFDSFDSESNTYVISSAEQLNNLSKLVAMGVFGPQHTFKLGNDIDYSESNEALIPIGSDDTPFYSTFDGQGRTIKNLKVVGEDLADVGMFGYVANGATIKNYILENPVIYGTSADANYQYSYQNRNNNPLKKALCNADSSFESKVNNISITISETQSDPDTKEEDVGFKSFSFSNLDAFQPYTPQIYINRPEFISTTDNKTFKINENNISSLESGYFTVEIYIEGIINDGQNNLFSRFTLERYKIYYDSTKKYFVSSKTNVHVYKKTIETEPTYVQGSIGQQATFFYNKHVNYLGIVCGHLDGKADRIGVVAPTIKASTKPFRSNSLLIGKKIDDDDVASMAKEYADFSTHYVNSDLEFTIYNQNGSLKKPTIDYDTSNSYINNIYSSSGNSFSNTSNTDGYLRIYGKQNQSISETNLSLQSHKYISNEYDKNGNPITKQGKFLSFKDKIDCYLSDDSSSLTYGSINMFQNNCISMWITKDGGLSSIWNSLFNETGDFYLKFNFDYLFFDSKIQKDNDQSNIKLKIMSTFKNKEQKKGTILGFIPVTYQPYEFTSNMNNTNYDPRTDGYYNAYTINTGTTGSGKYANYSYIDTTDGNPLILNDATYNYNKYDNTTDINSSPLKLGHKEIYVVSNTTSWQNLMSNSAGRTPIFCLGIDGSTVEEGQKYALEILNFEVQLTTLNGNYAGDPITVDFFQAEHGASLSGTTWSNWPKHSNVRVGVSCFSKILGEGNTIDNKGTVTITNNNPSFDPKYPNSATPYVISVTRSDGTNNSNIVKVVYSNPPDDTESIPKNEVGFTKAKITLN